MPVGVVRRQAAFSRLNAVYAESASATNLVGTVPAANLPGVARLAGGNAFSGLQSFSSGNVGTVIPQALLEVNGATLVDGELKAAGSSGALSFLNRNNQTEKWQWNADNSGVSLQNFSGSAGIPWHVAENGYVGLGTTTPKHQLDVNGNIWLGSQDNGQVFTEKDGTLYLGASLK